MKINQWTRALLATGVVGIGAVAQAEEAPSSNVLTAVSGTQISGYVSTSATWAPNTMAPAPVSFGPAVDGFNLDNIDLTISKPLDEGEWSAGYTAELWAGPNGGAALGNAIAPGISIKQANVQLNAPIGNGVVFTMGVFDTIIGYEVANVGANPNYTRSYGFTSEPFQHLGLLASYQVCEGVSLSAGIADARNTVLNPGNRPGNNSRKTYMAAATFTAPESAGVLAGSSLTAGVVAGRTGGGAPGSDAEQIYVGATIPTPIENVTLGVAWDHFNTTGADTDTLAGYVGYRLSDSAALNLRLDYLDEGGASAGTVGGEYLGTTLTLNYALWKNVITRAEWRYDKDLDGNQFAGPAAAAAAGARNNNHLFALNVIYQF